MATGTGAPTARPGARVRSLPDSRSVDDHRGTNLADHDLAAHLVDHVLDVGGLDLLERPTLVLLGHHRGPGLADRAALALKADLLDRAILGLQVHRHHVAAAGV